MTESAKKYGQRIKEIRVAKELTQQELAERLGIKRETINNVENGRQKPTIEFLIKLSSEVNMSLDEILQVETTLGNDQIEKLFDKSRADISYEELEKIKQYIKSLEAEKQKAITEFQSLSERHEAILIQLEDFRQKFSGFLR
ncbi:MAG: helix-turn-helix domain-containing protein [Cyclobacteriaceae bacterium]